MADVTCGKCGEPIKQVDLYGTPFFTHKPRRDCLTWWHVNSRRNNHQAVPDLHQPPDQPCDRCAFIPTPDGKCICREVVS